MDSKFVVITGASRGIGYECARLCNLEGHTVLAVGKDSTRLFQVAQRLDGILTFRADLAIEAEVNALVSYIRTRW